MHRVLHKVGQTSRCYYMSHFEYKMIYQCMPNNYLPLHHYEHFNVYSCNRKLHSACILSYGTDKMKVMHQITPQMTVIH